MFDAWDFCIFFSDEVQLTCSFVLLLEEVAALSCEGLFERLLMMFFEICCVFSQSANQLLAVNEYHLLGLAAFRVMLNFILHAFSVVLVHTL